MYHAAYSTRLHDKGNPVSILETPKFVPQSEPDSVVETGIGQDPLSGGIFFQWCGPEAVGYKIYRADSSGVSGATNAFSMLHDLNGIGGAIDTLMTDSGSIHSNVTYSYYIVAYSNDGNSSSPSNVITYTLLDRPTLYSPIANVKVDSSRLAFQWNENANAEYTVIRVEDLNIIPPTFVWVSLRFELNGALPQVQYNFDGVASSSLISGHSYQWRVDRFNVDGTGRPYEGSRSAWGTFTVK